MNPPVVSRVDQDSVDDDSRESSVTLASAQTTPNVSRRPIRSPSKQMAIGMLTRGYIPTRGVMIEALPLLAYAIRTAKLPSARVNPSPAAKSQVCHETDSGKGCL